MNGIISWLIILIGEYSFWFGIMQEEDNNKVLIGIFIKVY